MMGWECPRCGQTYAPYIEKCGNCLPRVSYASGTNPLPPTTGNPVPEPTARVWVQAPPLSTERWG